MKLYYMPGACSLADHIALEWANADYEACAVSRDALKQPEFLALNPMGSVPCLTDGDFVLFRRKISTSSTTRRQRQTSASKRHALVSLL